MSNDFASMMQQAGGPEDGRTRARLRPGQAVTGTVVQIGHDSVFVDVGGTTEGRIDRRELEDAKGELKVKAGDTLRASVVSVDDVLGPKLTIAFGKGKVRLDEGALETARDARLPVEGVIGAAVKGGVEVKILGARAFCPASQLGTEYIADLASLEGQKVEFLVMEVKNGGRDIIVSRKALLLERQNRDAAEMLSQLQVGNDYPAKVVSIQKYGAFVDLGGGVEGLIHISELAHGRIDRVEDVLNVGENITVRLLALSPGEKKGSAPKLRLSLRALADAPPESATPEKGEVLEGTVSKVESFGVFVDTAKGNGLVPSRELGTPRNSDSRRLFPIGKVVSVVLISKDASRGITFSMARVANVEERQNFRDFEKAQKAQRDEPGSLGSFGALLRQELNLPLPAPPPPAPPAPAAAASASAATGAAAASPPERLQPRPPVSAKAPTAVFSGPAPERTRVAEDAPRTEERPRAAQSGRLVPTKNEKERQEAKATSFGVVRGRRAKPGS